MQSPSQAPTRPDVPWHLVYSKPRQEFMALENLQRQGFEVYLPLYRRQKVRGGKAAWVDEPLFSRYLFVRLRPEQSGAGWAPVRSTKGVSRLVVFGAQAARVPAGLPEFLMEQERTLREEPQWLYQSGDAVVVTTGPFAGLHAVFQMNDGEQRAMVLIEFMGKAVRMVVSPSQITSPERAMRV